MILRVAVLIIVLAWLAGLAVGYRSFTVDHHRWRGFSAGRDLLDLFLVLGFLTIWLSRQRMTDRLKLMMGELRKLKEQL